MFRVKVGVVCVGILLVLMLVVTSTISAEPKMVKVLDNIYTLINGDGLDSNSTAVISKEGVVVIDTRITPGEARKFLSALREKTDQPVRYVINSHFHGDMTFGNQVFKDTATIIAHKNIRRNLGDENGLHHLDFFKGLLKLPGLDEVKITLPHIIYEEKMELVVGGVRFQLMNLGRGHTDGDTAVFLQELKTLIVGGLVSNKKIPYLGDAYIDDWIDFLAKLDDLNAEIIIPGRGEPGGKPLLMQMKHYLMILRNNVEMQVALKKTLKETKEAVRPILLERFQDWDSQELIDGNIERAYKEYSSKKTN